MSECKIDGHSGGWDRHGKAYCLTCGESNNENDSAKAFEEAWSELTAPQNETVTSKWYFKKGFEAAEKRLLLSRVKLPNQDIVEIASIKDSASLRYDNKEKYCTNKDFVEARSKAFVRGAFWYRDNLRTVPMTEVDVLQAEKEAMFRCLTMIANNRDGCSCNKEDQHDLCSHCWFRKNAFGCLREVEDLRKKIAGK